MSLLCTYCLLLLFVADSRFAALRNQLQLWSWPRRCAVTAMKVADRCLEFYSSRADNMERALLAEGLGFLRDMCAEGWRRVPYCLLLIADS